MTMALNIDGEKVVLEDKTIGITLTINKKEGTTITGSFICLGNILSPILTPYWMSQIWGQEKAKKVGPRHECNPQRVDREGAMYPLHEKVVEVGEKRPLWGIIMVSFQF